MLRLLRIRNFAIIDELELEFSAGFNAITGETGAGKSIILDAVGLILGERADTGVIRSGSEEATVEAVFDVASNEAFERKLRANGFEAPGSEHEVIVKRTVHRSGKNKIFFNGELVTLGQLGDLCENLVDLCSQHEHQSLSKAGFQLDLIDRYGGLLEKRREVRETHSALRSRESELTALGGDEGERARGEDFLRFQLAEIDEFGPREGEEEELAAERRRLLNATQLLDSAGQALSLLGGGPGGQDGQDALDARSLIGRAHQRVGKVLPLDAALGPAAEAAQRALVEVDEAVAQLEAYCAGIDADPARLEAVENRVARWSEIRRKYGPSAQAVLETRSRIEAELGEWAHREERLARLTDVVSSLREEYAKCAADLSKRRRNVAKTLRQSIEQELRELLMPAARFEIEVASAPPAEGGADGIDRVQFLFSPNAGEDLKLISKIASGGELSRLMLAVRRTIADRGGIGVYVFDEIDSGIGGQTASVVGKKLRSVAKYNQLIVITHLPQVAAFGGAHYRVTKKVAAGRTVSQIGLLGGVERIEELARMLGGLNVTEKSRAVARDLIKQAAP